MNQDNFLFICEQCQKSYLWKEKENREVKKMHANI